VLREIYQTKEFQRRSDFGGESDEKRSRLVLLRKSGKERLSDYICKAQIREYDYIRKVQKGYPIIYVGTRLYM
jgi:hypothetical protein